MSHGGLVSYCLLLLLVGVIGNSSAEAAQTRAIPLRMSTLSGVTVEAIGVRPRTLGETPADVGGPSEWNGNSAAVDDGSGFGDWGAGGAGENDSDDSANWAGDLGPPSEDVADPFDAPSEESLGSASEESPLDSGGAASNPFGGEEDPFSGGDPFGAAEEDPFEETAGSPSTGAARDPFGGGDVVSPGAPAESRDTFSGPTATSPATTGVKPVPRGSTRRGNTNTRDVRKRLADDTGGSPHSHTNPVAGVSPGRSPMRGVASGEGGTRDLRTPLADDFHFPDPSLNPSFSEGIEFADPSGTSLEGDVQAAALRNGHGGRSRPQNGGRRYQPSRQQRPQVAGYEQSSHGLLGPNEALVSFNNPSFPSSAYLSVFDTTRGHENGVFRESRPWRGHHRGGPRDLRCRTNQAPHTAGYTAPAGLRCHGPAGRCSVARLECGYEGSSGYEAKTYFMFQTKSDRDAFVRRWRSGSGRGHQPYAGSTTHIREGHPMVSFASRFSATHQMVATKIVGHSGVIDVANAGTGRHVYQLKCLRNVHAVKYKLFPPPHSFRCEDDGSGGCKGLMLRCARLSHGQPASAYASVWLMFASGRERDHMANCVLDDVVTARLAVELGGTTGMAAGPGLKGDSTPTAVAAAAGKTTENSYRRNRVWRGNGPSTGTLRWVVKPYQSRGKGGGKGGAHSRFRGGPKHRDGRKGGGRVESDKTSTIAESVEAYEDEEEEPRKGSSAQSTASGCSSPVSEGLASSPAEEHTGPCSTTSSATGSSQSSKTRPGPSPDGVGQEPIPQDMAVSTSLRIAWGAMTCTCPECTQRVADSVLKCFTERKTWTPGEAVDVGNEISSMPVQHSPHGRPSLADRNAISSASTRLSSPSSSSSSHENAYTKHPCRLRLVGDMSRACREELLYGRCKRGAACQFSHDRSHAEALRKMHKSQMCRWGRDCYFGANCLYSHSQAEIADAQAWLIGGPLDKYSRERYLVHQSKMTTDLFTELQRKHQYRYEDPFYPTTAMAPGGGGLAPMLLQPGGPPAAHYGGNRGMGRYH
ncbi:hypothetical protein FOZ60_006732 [Perkinsus olseni]|uniref:C3H1-type domain-containing protein n=2 Tax=Perkinsus olseni TaxID=32597 RepID=A0A7J6PFJ5_PEROL|nr:hypothetical protein FOZ60_006732 [Perkinsus olseni]